MSWMPRAPSRSAIVCPTSPLVPAITSSHTVSRQASADSLPPRIFANRLRSVPSVESAHSPSRVCAAYTSRGVGVAGSAGWPEPRAASASAGGVGAATEAVRASAAAEPDVGAGVSVSRASHHTTTAPITPIATTTRSLALAGLWCGMSRSGSRVEYDDEVTQVYHGAPVPPAPPSPPPYVHPPAPLPSSAERPRVMIANRGDGELLFWLGRLYGFAGLVVAMLFLLTMFCVYGYFSVNAPPVPDLERYVTVTPGVSRVYAADGTLLGEFAKEWR